MYMNLARRGQHRHSQYVTQKHMNQTSIIVDGVVLKDNN